MLNMQCCGKLVVWQEGSNIRRDAGNKNCSTKMWAMKVSNSYQSLECSLMVYLPK